GSYAAAGLASILQVSFPSASARFAANLPSSERALYAAATEQVTRERKAATASLRVSAVRPSSKTAEMTPAVIFDSRNGMSRGRRFRAADARTTASGDGMIAKKDSASAGRTSSR